MSRFASIHFFSTARWRESTATLIARTTSVSGLNLEESKKFLQHFLVPAIIRMWGWLRFRINGNPVPRRCREIQTGNRHPSEPFADKSSSKVPPHQLEGTPKSFAAETLAARCGLAGRDRGGQCRLECQRGLDLLDQEGTHHVAFLGARHAAFACSG